MSYPSSNTLQIPGANAFLFNFSMNLNPPLAPLPQQKTLPYPTQSTQPPTPSYFDIVQSSPILPNFEILPMIYHYNQYKIQKIEQKQETDYIEYIQKRQDKTQKLNLQNHQQQEKQIININQLDEIIEKGFNYDCQKHPVTGKVIKKKYQILQNQEQSVLIGVISKEKNLENSLLKVDRDFDDQEVLKIWEKNNQEDGKFEFDGNYAFTKNINLQDEILFQFNEQEQKVVLKQIKGEFILHRQRLFFLFRKLFQNNKCVQKNILLNYNDDQRIIKKVKLSSPSEENQYNPGEVQSLSDLDSEQESEYQSDQDSEQQSQNQNQKNSQDDSSGELKY